MFRYRREIDFMNIHKFNKIRTTSLIRTGFMYYSSRWLTLERCCLCQQLTMWLNLTTAMFFRLGIYWVSIAKPIYNIGISRFTRLCNFPAI
jgi:hypothetical protein